MLVSKCEENSNFSFFRGWRCTGIIEQNGRVNGIKIVQGSEVREIEGDIVIGSDGRTSALRRLLNPELHVYKQIIDVVWFRLPRPEFLGHGIGLVSVSPGNACLSFPVYGDQLQVGWLIKKGHFGEIKRQGKEVWFQNLLNSLPKDFSSHLEKHHDKASDYFVLDVACSCLQNWHHRGVLMIGDASHTMSPVGAQGINLALRDSIVSANELMPVLEGDKENMARIDIAFERIQRERIEEVKRIQKFQQVPPKLIFLQNSLAKLFVSNLPWLSRRGLVKRMFSRLGRVFAFGHSDVTLRV
jgi:2-polyprenyl-6-methoxyphenol hydroxylase-like FAD-dependent oxidoreductase